MATTANPAQRWWCKQIFLMKRMPVLLFALSPHTKLMRRYFVCHCNRANIMVLPHHRDKIRQIIGVISAAQLKEVNTGIKLWLDLAE